MTVSGPICFPTRTLSHPGLVEELAALWSAVKRAVARLLFFATRGATGAEDGGLETRELIRRFQRGQSLMFEALFNRYKDYVYRVAFYVTRNAAEAEDATQEAFLDVLKALPGYDIDGPARFETWLYRVTVNRCKMRLRRKRPPSVEWGEVEERLERLPHPGEDPPETRMLRSERADDLWRAVDALPEEHRAVLLLRYREEMAYQEIADALSIQLGTVKSRLYNAHKKLKRLLAGHNP